MKKIFFIALILMVTAIAFTSCTTSGYVTQPHSNRYYRGTPTHVDVNRGYNRSHGNVYRGNSHGRAVRGHRGW